MSFFQFLYSRLHSKMCFSCFYFFVQNVQKNPVFSKSLTKTNSSIFRSRSRSPDVPSKKSAPPAPRDTWLRPNLRVRLIDEDSKYYNTKVRVEDVVSPYSCVVRTESGRVLDDVDPRYAHTTNSVDFYCLQIIRLNLLRL